MLCYYPLLLFCVIAVFFFCFVFVQADFMELQLWGKQISTWSGIKKVCCASCFYGHGKAHPCATVVTSSWDRPRNFTFSTPEKMQHQQWPRIPRFVPSAQNGMVDKCCHNNAFILSASTCMLRNLRHKFRHHHSPWWTRWTPYRGLHAVQQIVSVKTAHSTSAKSANVSEMLA